MTRRRSRSETTAQNRADVLAAARAQFETHGYHGATLEAIADAAGFSKGVVYSRFGSKDELFLALLADHIVERHERTAAAFEALDPGHEVDDLARISIEASVSTVAWQAALLEFRAHAWRHPEVNARYAALHEQTVASIAGFIAAAYARRGETLPVPADLAARAALAGGTGIVTEFMADPGIDVTALVGALAPASSRPSGAEGVSE